MEVLEGSAQSWLERGSGSGEEDEGSLSRAVRQVDATGDRVTRQTKLDFPGFDGSRVQEWLFKYDRFFQLDGTPAEMKVSIASVYLSGVGME